ncbi:hypothetical protein H2200_013062 [Cladophialophora chaetospira]|uniref:Wax synthase domain-containing protein n=1 Tax=Cladophialophora chaetospira TaxID=386627 RepID=A0AA38WWP4_9EURO|nr:hypothetical protein H2200_013062 [Cladophialophora chaetospira]
MGGEMSHAHAEENVREQLLVLRQTGNVIPANSGIDSLNLILLLVWLLVSPLVSDASSGRFRVPVFIGVVTSSIWNLFHVRSIGIIGSIGVGMNSVLISVLAANFIILHDARTFKRLAFRPASKSVAAAKPAGGKQSSNAPDRPESIPLAWEPMPASPSRRLFWSLDLVSSVRAVHWSWKPSPSPPYHQSLSVIRPSRTATLPSDLLRFIRGYLLIDLVKCLMIEDPYFLGDTSYGVPPHLSAYIASRHALYIYRLLFAVIGIYLAVDLQYITTKLIQVNILGPNILGFNASPNTFLPCWGSPRAILRKGLRGFWGETWHQMFRVHFASIGDAVADRVLQDHSRKAQKSSSARVWIRVVVSFLLSGVLHACASYTLLGPSRPWRSFIFFAIQPIGLAVQSISSQIFAGSSVSQKLGSWNAPVRQSLNLVFTVLWLWTLGGILLDDLDSGGMWLFEPVPFSIIRCLGFSQDKKIWCW